MPWLKRNMMLVVSGVVALLAVGAGVYYLWTSYGENRRMDEELGGLQAQMDQILAMKPFPHATNITAGRDQVKLLEQSVAQAREHFVPIPYATASGLAFKTDLDKTIFELTQKANASRIGLPDTPYYFSFKAQKEKLNLDPGSFPAINLQLAEVKAITEILFDAKIHSLIGLKRVRVSPDDPGGSKDYRPEWNFETNAVTKAVMSPYEIVFTGFSADLANVMDGFVRSRHGFLIRAIAVDRFVERQERPGALRPGFPNRVGLTPATAPGGRLPVRGRPPTNPNENQTVLNEERFLAVMWLAVIRPEGG